MHPNLNQQSKDSINNKGIYLLQSIKVNSNKLNIFYDNGCTDFIVSENAVKLLGKYAKKQNAEPIQLGGVGNMTMESLGACSVTLPQYNGQMVTLSGLCICQITSDFPIYPLKNVENDIQRHYTSSGGTNFLPKLPSAVGGEIHLMIGVKYLRYHPKPVHQLPSGLKLFQSSFCNPNGELGVVGGKVFIDVHKNFFNSSNTSIFFNSQCDIFRREFSQETDIPLLGYGKDHLSVNEITEYSQAHLSKLQIKFEQIESTGTEINYRCPTYRGCHSCTHHDEYESISIREEIEQSIIESSVTIDLDTSITSASFPFTAGPRLRLAPNKNLAMKVYYQQLKKLNQPGNIQDKNDIIKSENKLQQMGFVEYIRNLPSDVQVMLQDNPIKYFIPWRAV